MGSPTQSLPEGSVYHIVTQRMGVSLHWGSFSGSLPYFSGDLNRDPNLEKYPYRRYLGPLSYVGTLSIRLKYLGYMKPSALNLKA